MDKSVQFETYRKEYKEFYYNGFSLTDDQEAIYMDFDFEIPGLKKFTPKYRIPKKNMNFKSINTAYAKNIAFNIGMIEIINYWKCVCPPKIVVKCGYLTKEQIDFWKKIYFYGLGELFFTNNIKTDMESFVTIELATEGNEHSEKQNENVYAQSEDDFSGYIVPIGGGKDSVVTLETLQVNKEKDFALIINPKPVTLKCAEIAGFDTNNIIEIYRTLDKGILELNEQGFINGHTPFSAMLAFVSYFTAYLLGKKYVALSNESSANESNVVGEKINHQYSKSFEFECDFENYASKFLKAPIKYFSFLRPLNELQIAKIFSKHEKYHKTFKSCNVGSKFQEWKWCCNCAKCLFAYIILSPYLYKEKLVDIFGEDLYEKEELQKTFIELTGNGETKPFDCVGTYEEVNFAISKTIENFEKNNSTKNLESNKNQENIEIIENNNKAKFENSNKTKIVNHDKTEIENCDKIEIENCDKAEIMKNIENAELAKNDEKSNGRLPLLLEYYKKTFGLVNTKEDITLRYNNENNLTQEQNDMLRKEVF